MSPKTSGFLERLPRPAARWSRLFGLSALVGLAGGLAAAALEWGLDHGSSFLIGRYTHLGGTGVLRFDWGVLLLPAAGGLLSGLIVYWLCPKALGHGTDVLTHAFHHQFGRLNLRGPLVKATAAIGVISCGGSAGPEGPIAALGAGLGSTFGRVFGLNARERRVMLVSGCAAGVGAIFGCPLGGALFAAGILYREPEFESDAIVPAFVASVFGYSAYMLFALREFGEFMLDGANTMAFDQPAELILYAVLGPLCGLFSILFYLCVRTVEDKITPATHLPVWLTPAIGGLATGAIACVLPQVMDGQYRFIQNAIDGNFGPGMGDLSPWSWAKLFGAVAVMKCVATALTVGSGGSGGVLGPSLFVGGAVGAFLGAAAEAIAPGMVSVELQKAMIPVGMAGVLAASMRIPMAALVMTIEMTGSYGLIVPLMLVCSSAYVTGRRFGLNSAQVRGAAESPAHAADAVVHILESVRVSSLVERNWPLVAAPDARLPELVSKISFGTRPVFAVVDNDRIVGLISVPDIQRMVEEPGMADMLIAEDMMTESLAVVHPDHDLYQALEVFRRENHDVMPVVARGRHGAWVGMLSRENVFKTVRERIREMQKMVIREHAGLAAMDQEGQLQQLVMGVSPMRTDRVQRLLVPLQVIGKSLREADFRRNFNAQVVAIEQSDGTLQCPPDPDAPLSTAQRLVAIVWEAPNDSDEQSQ